jgi:hypothetical protein
LTSASSQCPSKRTFPRRIRRRGHECAWMLRADRAELNGVASAGPRACWSRFAPAQVPDRRFCVRDPLERCARTVGEQPTDYSAAYAHCWVALRTNRTQTNDGEHHRPHRRPSAARSWEAVADETSKPWSSGGIHDQSPRRFSRASSPKTIVDVGVSEIRTCWRSGCSRQHTDFAWVADAFLDS